MRVAVVNHHPDHVVGGSELQCHLVADGLAARGHDVTYVAVRPAGADGPAGPGERYAVVEVAHDPAAVLAALLALRPDVVYWRFNRRGLSETVAGLRAAGIPLVLAIAHVDDVTRWPSWPRPGAGAGPRDRVADLRARVRHRRSHRTLRQVAAIASQREDLLDRVPRSAVPLQRHVPNAMLVAEEPFTWPRPFVAWVGNLKPRKRPELIPAIAESLAGHGIDVVVAGPVRDERLAGLLRPSARTPNLHHVGVLSTSGVVGMLRSARCLAVTSLPEGFSNVMIQAWWAATPTVSLAYDPDGLVTAEDLGALAEGDVERFLAEVVRFATDETVAREAGERAARFAQERFAPAAVLDRLEALLVEVAP